MVDYRQVMRLLLRGESYRLIQARTGAAPATISKAKKSMDAHGIVDEAQVNDLNSEDLPKMVGDKRSIAFSDFVPIDFDEVAAERVGRKKTPLNVLWSNYVATPAGPGQRHYSYERFRQNVHHEFARQGISMFNLYEPGLTMQVDWAGTKMYLVDPLTTRRRGVSVFVASLPYSGMVFATARINEKQEHWNECHRLAFEYFGGVCEVVVPDNASTASNPLCSKDPARKVNASFEDLLAHYNCGALPTRPIKPRDKGTVESGVRTVTNWVIRKLRPREFSNLDDLNEAIAAQVEWINDRTPFRDRQESRRMLFNEHEKPYLQALPDEPYTQSSWRKSKVAPNWHITLDTVHYSVPYTLISRVVDVRIRGEKLDVFDDGKAVATHTVSVQRGAYVTDVAHCPPGMELHNNYWNSDYFLKEARKVGPATLAAISSVLDSRPIKAQAYLPCRNILELQKRHSKTLLEQACERLTSQERPRAVSYNAVKNMITALRNESASRPLHAPARPDAGPTTAPAPPRPEDTGLLGGVEQFRLDNLLGTTNPHTRTEQETDHDL